jgi:hypothetical protein
MESKWGNERAFSVFFKRWVIFPSIACGLIAGISLAVTIYTYAIARTYSEGSTIWQKAFPGGTIWSLFQPSIFSVFLFVLSVWPILRREKIRQIFIEGSQNAQEDSIFSKLLRPSGMFARSAIFFTFFALINFHSVWTRCQSVFQSS